jgi:hypothetical protein
MGLFNDDMTGLAAAYASMNDGKYLLTNADKVGNTPAWQNRYKVNESTGEMLYEMADHLKEAYEEELIAKIDATLEELRRLDEGKIPAELQAYLDKKKGKKGNGDKKEEDNGNGNGNGSKGSKPDFLDLDKDGDKKEPMKKAAKEKKMNEDAQDDAMAQMMGRGGDPQSDAVKQYVKYSSKTNKKKMKKEDADYNYVNYYVEKVMGADPTMRMMAAKDRMKGKDKLLPKKEGEKHAANMARKIKMSPSYAGAMGEETFKRLADSGFFTEEEVTRILWSDFEENYRAMRDPEKYKDPDESDKPYHKRSKAARMRDPERGINSPAFKKFMADRGM